MRLASDHRAIPRQQRAATQAGARFQVRWHQRFPGWVRLIAQTSAVAASPCPAAPLGLLDPCWTKITISEQGEADALPGPGISKTCVVGKPDVRTHGIRISARDANFT